jgi:uncharacterized protein YbjT (DUF2867 family)/FixJ family two-component response regulator
MRLNEEMKPAEPVVTRLTTPDIPERAAPGRVLIVDDDQTMCEAMELTLVRRDLEITWRTSAHDALELVAAHDFDVILTDLAMPTMSGIELCERVLAARPEVPVVVVTGHNSVEAAISAIRAGAYDLIVKPVDGELLALTVSRAIQHRRFCDEVRRLRAPARAVTESGAPQDRHSVAVLSAPAGEARLRSSEPRAQHPGEVLACSPDGAAGPHPRRATIAEEAMFVVAGATGRTGRIVAETLLAENRSIRLIVRDPGKVAALAARGAEVARASLDDAAALVEAFRGANGAFILIPPAGPADTGILASGQKIADAIGKAIAQSSLKHVVLLSSIGAQHAEGTGMIRILHHAEQVLRALPIAATFVRAGFFMENLVGSLEQVLKSETYYSFSEPSKKMPMVATHDIGVTAAQALLDVHEGKNVIDLGGPEDHSSTDVAGTLGKLLGKRVHVASVPRDAQVGAMTSMGVGREMAELYVELYDGLREGKLTWEADTAKHARGKITLAHFLASVLEHRRLQSHAALPKTG